MDMIGEVMFHFILFWVGDLWFQDKRNTLRE